MDRSPSVLTTNRSPLSVAFVRILRPLGDCSICSRPSASNVIWAASEEAIVMLRPFRSKASDSGDSRRREIPLRRRCCSPPCRFFVTRSATVAGLSLRDGLRRYVPVRRFVTALLRLPLPLAYQSPCQSYLTPDIL